jgi:Domain of unknown function (DUF4157)
MPERDQESAPSAVKAHQRLTADRSEERETSPPAVERDVVDRVTCRAGDDSCATAHASTLNRATASQPARAERSLLQLQRQYGNRYVERVLSLAREGAHAEDTNSGVSSNVENAIQQKRGGGNSLDSGVRGQMEGALGADFSGVRVHVDTQADSLNRSLSARAFTTGKDIFFRQGAYEPGSSSGRELIAHELTHVVQQDGDKVRRAMTVSQPGDPHEVEAEHTARAVMQLEHAGAEKERDTEPESLSASRSAVQRQPEEPHKEDEEEKKKHHAMMKADRASLSRQMEKKDRLGL